MLSRHGYFVMVSSYEEIDVNAYGNTIESGYGGDAGIIERFTII